MKRILQNSFGKTILCLLLALVSMPAWAGDNDYYSRVTATAVGEGKVYVKYKNAATNTELNNSGNFKNSSTAESSADTQNSAPTHKYYLSAKANVGSYFVGWYGNNDSQCTGNIVSTKDTNYDISFTASSTDGSSPTTQNRYAKFVAFDPVTFSVPEGTYGEPQNVTLSCATSGATIKYSFDNSTWNTYSTPIPVTKNTTIYARAEKNQGQSNVYSAAYTLLLTLANDGDNTSLISSSNGNTCNVKLADRTFSPGKWYTLCLPFDVTIANSPLAGADARELDEENTKIEGKTLKLEFTSVTELKAGTPYIIRWESGSNIVNPVFENVTISKVTPEVVCDLSNSRAVQFVGTYDPKTYEEVDQSKLFINNNTFYYVGVGTTIGAQRAYFQLIGFIYDTGAASTGGVKEFGITFTDEDPTGIASPLGETEEGVSIYNLSGQRINKMQKGINIVNGKKIMVK